MKLQPTTFNNVSKRQETIRKKSLELGISVEEYHSRYITKMHAQRTSEQKSQSALKRMEKVIENKSIKEGRSVYRLYTLFDKIIKIQGFEHIVLDYLQYDIKYQDEIICGGRPMVIPYIDGSGNKRSYFPDLFLPDLNLVIETKSDYTINQHLEDTLHKGLYTLKSGHSFTVFIPEKNEVRKNKLERSKNILNWIISSQSANPSNVVWYAKGSTTISEESSSKQSEMLGILRKLYTKDSDIV